MAVLNILAVSHGTDSLEGQDAIAYVRAELQTLLDARSAQDENQYRVHEAYVDVQTPSVDDAAQALPHDEICVMVPILLSTGFHTQVDMRRAARMSGVEDLRLTASLGPDIRLARLQRLRLEEAGWLPQGSSSDSEKPLVVQASAGSSRSDGRADMQRAAELLAEELQNPAQNAFIAQIDPKLSDVAQQVQPAFASTYLLAEGFFAEKMRRDLARVSGSTVVAAPLVSSHDAASARVVAQCALTRLDEALSAPSTQEV